MRIAIAAFTSAGRTTAERLVSLLRNTGNAYEFSCFDKSRENISEWAGREFFSSKAIVFIGATGIAARLIAPLLRGKDKDPAVLVIDEKARYVISLLSGHLGGANTLAARFAALLGAEPVITTATDLNGVFAVDEWSKTAGCAIDDIQMVKHISSALLAGASVGLHSDFPVTGALPQGVEEGQNFETGICISLDSAKKPFPITLNLLPQIAVMGTGCKKGISPEKFEAFALKHLTACSISPKSLRALCSIDIKQQEPCLLNFAERYGLKLLTFSAEELARVKGGFASSAFVQQTTGVDNVCERAAILGGGNNFVLRKTAQDGMTLAIAVADWQCSF